MVSTAALPLLIGWRNRHTPAASGGVEAAVAQMWAAMLSLRVQPQMYDLEYAAIRTASARTRSRFRSRSLDRCLLPVTVSDGRSIGTVSSSILELECFRFSQRNSLLGIALVQADVIDHLR